MPSKNVGNKGEGGKVNLSQGIVLNGHGGKKGESGKGRELGTRSQKGNLTQSDLT